MTTDTISLLPLYPLQYEPLVHQALAEDLGLAGDLTTNAIIPPQARVAGRLVARRAGCIAGLEVAASGSQYDSGRSAWHGPGFAQR